MSNKENKKFGDIVENHDLIKRTLMVAAYPALIKSVVKEGDTLFEGFLPGFEFANIEDIASEDECVEYLQDMLDDEVEELVVFGKSLPQVEEDEKLLEKNPDYKIVYLDINVYATKEELELYDSCNHNCGDCAHKCGEDEFYDDEDLYDYDDCDDDCCCRHHEDCDCGHHHHHYHDNSDDDCDCCDDDCDCCDDDCDCCHDDDNCNCGDDSTCDNSSKEICNSNLKKNNKSCNCKTDTTGDKKAKNPKQKSKTQNKTTKNNS